MKINPLYFIVITIITLLFSGICFAQDVDYLEDDGTSLWDEEGFIDSVGGLDEQFNTSDGQYIAEEELAAQQEAIRASEGSGLDIAAALEKDKQLLPDNILYGIGTGSVIGGWFALWSGKSGRENVQYISVGILAGVLLGITVGTKSFYQNTANEYPPEDIIMNRLRPTPTESPTTSAYSLLNFDVAF